MDSQESSRVERRRAATRARLLAAAARRFATHGFDEVRLDDIAEEADVARGTLYKHFASKDELLTAVIRPVLEHAERGVRGLAHLPAREAMRRLVEVYLDLWRQFPHELRLSFQIQGKRPLGDLAAVHGAFLTGVLAVLELTAREGLLRTGDPTLSAWTMARMAVPLLELYSSRPDADALFRESMEGLLFRS